MNLKIFFKALKNGSILSKLNYAVGVLATLVFSGCILIQIHKMIFKSPLPEELTQGERNYGYLTYNAIYLTYLASMLMVTLHNWFPDATANQSPYSTYHYHKLYSILQFLLAYHYLLLALLICLGVYLYSNGVLLAIPVGVVY